MLLKMDPDISLAKSWRKRGLRCSCIVDLVIGRVSCGCGVM